MKIGVVIVTFNRILKLQHSLCCYSNQSFQPEYILVIDNNSNDGTYEYLDRWVQEKEKYKKYVNHLPENIGGSGGFYVGMKQAMELESDWIWVADDDAYPRMDALEELSKTYESIDSEKKKRIVAVCSAVYNSGKPHCGHRNHLIVSPFKVQIIKSDPEEYKSVYFEFDILSYVGACIRKEALHKSGLPKASYFIYCDDQEHSMRLRKAGELICVPSSIVDHDTPPFDERIISWGKYYIKRNGFLMIKEHFPYRYFFLRYIKRYIWDVSLFSKKEKNLKTIYKSAYHDALIGRTGMHELYKPGWKPPITD